MDLNEYQRLAHKTQNPHLTAREIYAQCAMGLAGETGEVADLLKKYLFHGHFIDKEKVKRELGDVLWYVAELAGACGFTMTDVAGANIAKLMDRYPDGFSEERSRNRASE